MYHNLPTLAFRTNDSSEYIYVGQIVPMENLNGRKLVEDGELCERRNGMLVYFAT